MEHEVSAEGLLAQDIARARAILTAEEPQRIESLRSAMGLSRTSKSPHTFLRAGMIAERLDGALPLTFADAEALASAFTDSVAVRYQLAHLLLAVEGAAGKRSGALWEALDNVRRAVAGTEAL